MKAQEPARNSGCCRPCGGKVHAGVILAACALVVTACENESPTLEPPAVVEGIVVDASGVPVSGARIGLMYDFDPGSGGGGVSNAGHPPHTPMRIASPDTVPVPLEFSFGPGYPNPFARSTSLRFVLAQPSRVLVSVHDARGKPVRTLVDHDLPIGAHVVTWDVRDDGGSSVPNGQYVARIWLDEVGGFAPYGDVGMFRNDVDIAAIVDAYHAVTDTDGRFEIPMLGLPIGEPVNFVDIEAGDQGKHAVLSTVLICAVLEEDGTLHRDCADLDLGDLTRSVFVSLQFGQP